MSLIINIILIVTGARLFISCFNWLSNNYLVPYPPELFPLVSVCIPARNEEHHLPILLKCLREQSYSFMEILVYNDDSTDNTEEVIEIYKQYDDRIKSITGTSMPQGWTGKNWACHQLAQYVAGTYLCFIDADVWITKNVIHNIIGYMRHHDLSLLSCFPHQKNVFME